jgi:hypothetical protein
MFGATAVPGTSVAASHIEILLGASATMPNISAPAKPPTPPVVIPTTGPQGGAVGGKTGIPRVN